MVAPHGWYSGCTTWVVQWLHHMGGTVVALHGWYGECTTWVVQWLPHMGGTVVAPHGWYSGGIYIVGVQKGAVNQNRVGNSSTVMILSFRTKRSGQTVQTQIRLLRLHCLLFNLHLFDKIP